MVTDYWTVHQPAKDRSIYAVVKTGV